MMNLPAYTVRESKRAKHVNLKISIANGLEVIVPGGFDQSRIPEILYRKQSWIEKQQKHLRERQDFLAAQPILPQQIRLKAIDELWQVEYHVRPATGIRFKEMPNQSLRLRGQVDEVELCKLVLRKWLTYKAQKHLVPQLYSLSRAEKLRFKKAIVRGQKTRWGSYSSSGTLSLNYKLLFLPPPLVRYVLIHELCHIKHLNHSKRFWALVGKKEPNYKQLKADIRLAWRDVPGWAQVK